MRPKDQESSSSSTWSPRLLLRPVIAVVQLVPPFVRLSVRKRLILSVFVFSRDSTCHLVGLSVFVRDGIQAEWVSASLSSPFSRWDNFNALSYQANFVCGDFLWLACMDPNCWANFTNADRPDQPNLYFWVKISRWANLVNFHRIWLKLGM